MIELNFNVYQAAAKKTAVYPDKLSGRLENNLLGGTKMRSKLNDQTMQIESLQAEVKRLKDKLAFSLCLP